MFEKLKSLLINLLISIIVILVFCLFAELITSAFWNAGYNHPYDWRSRTEPYSTKKGKGTYRILVLGDSVAYGQGVKREKTFASLIEKYLNNNDTNGLIRNYEVINIAQPGINTADEYYEFTYKGLKYNPDMVIVAFYPNDLGDVNYNKTDLTKFPHYIRSSQNRPHWKWAIPIPLSMETFLVNNSDFYLFIMSKYDLILKKAGIRETIDHDSNLLKKYESESKDWKFTQQYLEEIFLLCKFRQMEALLVMIPTFYNIDEYPFGIIHDKVIKKASNIGFRTMDLLPTFSGKNKFELIVSRIDSHPNSKAHKLMAEEMYPIIKNIIKERTQL